jgi:SH3-like domain-containing protein
MTRLIIFILIFLPFIGIAEDKKLLIPRFASIKSNEVNARTGPSIKCPIEWIFVKKGEPIEIIAEYEQWRQIRDIKGEGGWVHSSVLSGKRSVIIISKDIIELTKYPKDFSRIVAKLSPNVRCQVNKCKDNECQLRCNSFVGWVPQKYLWGVYIDEKF